MFVIVVYDMKSDRTHIPRKILRQYLQHVQDSVFEGNITEGQLNKLKPMLKNITKDNESILVYEFSTEKYINRFSYGEDPRKDEQFI